MGMNRLLDKMQPFHTLTLPGQEPILRKGNAKPVVVTQEIRQNNKTVTKIVGVENFFIDPNEVCKALTKLCASSATCKYMSLSFAIVNCAEIYPSSQCTPWFKPKKPDEWNYGPRASIQACKPAVIGERSPKTVDWV